MTENSYSATLEIQNRKGLHARAAVRLLKPLKISTQKSAWKESGKKSAAVPSWD